MTVRLFTALKVSPLLAEQVEAMPRKGMDSPRWTHADDLHITLRFIGDINETKIESIIHSLDLIKVRNFGVAVKGLDVFHKPHRSILYAPVESIRGTTNLTTEITDRLQELGFVFTEQFYTPHVTLARVKNKHGIETYAKKNAKKIFAEWMANSFYLMQSAHAALGQTRYTVLKEYSLL